MYKEKQTTSYHMFKKLLSRVLLSWESPENREMAMFNRRAAISMLAKPDFALGFSRFFSKSTPSYIVKVGIPEFLNGVGRGVETHTAKLETEIGDFQKLLVTRTLKLKKFGIPVKHRKLILKYTQKYRLGLWRPRAEPMKSQ